MDQPHVARIDISPEFVAKALHFPEGTDILSAWIDRAANGLPILALVVEHSDLPGVAEADMAPTVSPVITYHRESWDFDWNVPAVTYEVTYDDPETVSEVS